MPASTTSTSERRAIVDRARQSWIERLVDLSRRNNLLFFRHLKRGTLDLTNADREALDDLFGDTAVGPERLARCRCRPPCRTGPRHLSPRTSEPRRAEPRNAVHRVQARELEERGWRSACRGSDRAAVGCVEKRPHGARVMLRRTGVAKSNPVLLHVLNVVHRCGVDEETLLSAAEREDEQTRFQWSVEHLLRARVAALGLGESIAPDARKQGERRG